MSKHIFASVILAGVVVSNVIASSGDAHWSHSGSDGPRNGGNLANDDKLCSAGKNQSPIDIRDTAPRGLFKLRFDNKPATLKILNNGHTIQFNYGQINTGPEHFVKIEDKQYALSTAMDNTSSLSISDEQYNLLQVISIHPPITRWTVAPIP